MKKVYLIISMVFIIGFLVTSIVFFLKNNALVPQLNNMKQLLGKADEEIKRFQSETKKMSKENEKLQADTISYLTFNNDLQKEKEDLQVKFNEAQKIIAEKEAQLEIITHRLEGAERKKNKEQTGLQEQLLKEKKEMEVKLQSLEEILQKERALYYHNLAVNYTMSKLYDAAIEAYKKSLTFNPDNADGHYNLGLLYENFKNDPKMAVLHYGKYLEFNPDATDKEEVMELIQKLK